jgi:CRP-like cAMP-binding protein
MVREEYDDDQLKAERHRASAASDSRSRRQEARVTSKSPKRIEPHILPASIGVGTPTARYERGQPVFRQGDAADAVFYIQDNRVEITVVSEQGKEGIIGC